MDYNETLISHLQNLPNSPGIYQYFDKNGKLLYVGKAKDLRKRVRSYFKITNDTVCPKDKLSPRIHLMITNTTQLKILLVKNEQDALILENSLIKSLRPKYNILLRDDKTYPYIYYNKKDSFPRLEMVREIKTKKNQIEKTEDIVYFGPYCSGAKELLDSIYEIVPLIQKKNCLKHKKACLFYQIDKCLAPCENKIESKEYKNFFATALNYIEKPHELIVALRKKMDKLSYMEKYEDAILLRERIKKLELVSRQENYSILDSVKRDNIDIFYLHLDEDSKSLFLKIFIRNGRIISSDHIILEHDKDINSEADIYVQHIINHYRANAFYPPEYIIMPNDLQIDKLNIQSALKEIVGKNIKLLQPKIGVKKEIIDMAKANAKEILRLENSLRYDENLLLKSLQDMLNLNRIPRSIEIFDTSHQSGENSVGGLVAYHNGDFKKDRYRRYILDGKDEYSQFSEMILRRLKLHAKSTTNDVEELPDLWILDGGAAQLNMVKTILNSTGINLDIIAISKEKTASINSNKSLRSNRAKGGANDILWAYIDEEITTFRLNKNDKRLLFCQKLRDEAHRWSINFHRKKKTQSMFK